MNKDKFESTERIFRTAYKMAKMNRPFTGLPIDAKVQELNSLELVSVLLSKFICTNIIDHIAEETRNTTVHLLDNNIKISVLVDESTTIRKERVLSPCLRCAISCNSPVETFFFCNRCFHTGSRFDQVGLPWFN
jgi:hypothetical protein